MASYCFPVSEVAAQKSEHLDSAGGYLHVVNGKGGKQRTCVTPRPALDALGAYLQGRESGYVFKGRDMGHLSTRQIQRLLDEVAKNAGLQETRPSRVRQRMKVTPHLLRHSFSRWTLDVGIDIANLSAAARACIAEHHGHLPEGAAQSSAARGRGSTRC